MARPKSEDKRNAILSAAARVFAIKGLGAATSAISKAAGVAEGTLFTYFKTKDDLMNDLYREIKLELADAMMSNFPRKKSVRVRLQHVWDCFVNWGAANPEQRKVLAQLEVWDGLSKEAAEAGSAPFTEVQTMAQDAMDQHLIRNLSHEYVAAMMRSLAETTIEFMARNPKNADHFRQTGFEVLWAGISKKKIKLRIWNECVLTH
jgi:AcrR family transcriptional regulator